MDNHFKKNSIQQSATNMNSQETKIKQNEQIFCEEDKIEGLVEYFEFLENYEKQSLRDLHTEEVLKDINNKYDILEKLIIIKNR